MKRPWQRVCPKCHNVIEWYPFPKQTEMEYKWRPVIPCGRCGARLRKTKAQLALQIVLMGVLAIVCLMWGTVWLLLALVASLLLFVNLKLEVIEP